MCAVLFMACTESPVTPEPEPNPDPDPDPVEDTIIEAQIAIDMEDSDMGQFVDWENGASMSAFMTDVKENENQKFTGTQSEGGILTDGELMTWEGEKNIYFLYPYSEEEIDFDVEAQSLKMSIESVQALDLDEGIDFTENPLVAMVSGATADPEDGEDIDRATLKNVFSAFEVYVDAVPADETVVGFKLSSPENKFFVGEASVNIASGEIVEGTETYISSVEAEVENGRVESAVLSLLLLPSDATADSVTVEVMTLSDERESDDDLNIYSMTIREGLLFERGDKLVIGGGNPLSLVEDFVEITAPVEPPVQKDLMLADISATSIPEQDLWVIMDEMAATSDFYGVRDALNALATSGRKISIEMPMLKDIPHGAIMGENKLSDEYTADLIASDLQGVTPQRVSRLESEAPKYLMQKYGEREAEAMAVAPFSAIGEPSYTVDDLDVKDYAVADNYSMVALVSFVAENAVGTGHYSFFRCGGLSEVSIPNAEWVGQQAFDGCVALTEVSFPEVERIYDWAFELSTKLQKVSFAKVHTVQYSAFKGCTALSEVSMPEAVTLEGYVFSSCKELVSISLPKVEVIGGYCFNMCKKLSDIDFPAVKKINNFAFMMCSALDEVSLPSVTFLGMQTFGFCTSLSDINLPKTDTLFQAVFFGSPKFESLDLPSIKYIGGGSFYGCTSLSNLTVNPEYYTVEDGVVYNSAKTKLIAYLSSKTDENFTAPSSVTSLELYAFGGSPTLKNATLGGVADLYYMAFDGCTALESLVAPNGKTLRAWLFNNCPNLTSIEMATNSGVYIAALEAGAFTADINGIPVNDNVALTIGSQNSAYVNGNVLSFGDTSYSFKSISFKN